MFAAELTLTNGAATAVWEVIASDGQRNEVFDFVAFISYSPNPGLNMPPAGTATVNGSLAPAPQFSEGYSGWWRSSSTLPIPRFVPGFAPSVNLFHIAIHATRLLFPFVINQGGFDTSIIISNVTEDPFGSPPQAGSIILYFYGPKAPSPINTGTVAAGQVYTTLASNVALGFRGYVIAVCHFYPARGYAMITDVGARNIASGYLAEIMKVE